MAPALYVSAAATTIENFEFIKRYASLASVVVFPVPLIPTNSIRYGSPEFFLSEIFDLMSIFPTESNRPLN